MGVILNKAVGIRAGLLAGGLLLITSGVAHAQAALEQSADINPANLARFGGFARDRNVGVLERPRPQYATEGLRVGAFQLLPAITGRIEYTDNLFATANAATSDTIYHIQPGALLQSNWSNHYLGIFANGHRRIHADHGSEDSTEWLIGVKGRLDIQRDAVAAGGASYEKLIEPRSSAGSPANAAKPVAFNVAKANVGGVKTFNRLRLSGKVGLQDLKYKNVQALSGGDIYQKDRSNTQFLFTTRAEYALRPSTSVFVELSADKRNFRNPQPGFTARDSSGYELTVGANFEYRLFRGEARVGHIQQSYEDTAFGDVSGLSIQGHVDYYITPLTTLSATTSRGVEDAAITGAGGSLQTTTGVRVDHELLRNLILNAEVNYGDDDYQGIDRLDKETRLGAGATYLLTRSVAVRARIEHLKVESSGVQRRQPFDDNRGVISLYYQF